jgi:alkylation response protein AidB-like acyl-CoA dehydrogenase
MTNTTTLEKRSGSARPQPAELRAEVRALLADWQDANPFVPRCDSWLRAADLGFSRALADRGLLGVTWPAPYGRGASYVGRLAVTEELLRAGAPVAAHWIGDRQIGPAILKHGSAALQEELLPPLARAEALFCLGMSEPEAGSDLAAVRTRAVPCEGGYRLTGRKIWTSGAHFATHIYVLARTTPLDQVTRRHEGLSEFVVDMSSAGIAVSPIVDMAGEHHFNEVTLDDVLVPAHRLLGTEGDGWAQVTGQLAFERGGPERLLSTYPLLRAAMAAPAVTASESLTERLGELVARLAVLRRLCLEIAQAMDGGAAPVQQAATCKYLGTRFEYDVIDFARAVVSAGAEHLRSEVESALLASPGFGIRGGSADVLLSLITKAELGR